MATSAASSATIVFPAPDVALQQPVHRLGTLHVRDDFAQRILLAGRQPEWQDLASRFTNPIVHDHRMRLVIRRVLPLAQHEPGLEQEELFEDQPLLRGRAKRIQLLHRADAGGKCVSARAWRRLGSRRSRRIASGTGSATSAGISESRRWTRVRCIRVVTDPAFS